jgi:hypothetical protein
MHLLNNTLLAGWTALFLASSRSHQPGSGTQLEEVGGEDGIDSSHSFPRVSLKLTLYHTVEDGIETGHSFRLVSLKFTLHTTQLYIFE